VIRIPDQFRAGSLGKFAAWATQAAGADPNPRNAIGFGVVGLIGFVADLTIFQIILSGGGSLATAHISGFLLASVLNFTLNRLFVFPSGKKRRYARFLGIGVLALALRGGVIAGTVNLLGLPAWFGLVAGVGTAAVVNYLGSLFFVFSTEHARAPKLRWHVWAVAAITYAFSLKLIYFGLVDLLPQEAYYWSYAQHPDWSYYDHPPMIAWLIGLGTTVFGDTEFGVRIGTFLIGIATVRWLVLLARNLYDRNAAFGALMLAASMPFLLLTGFFAMPDGPLVAFWAGTLYYLERAIFGDRPRAWAGVGICFGLGLLSKYTMALLGPAALAFMLIDRDARAHLKRPGPYLALILAIAVFSPVIYWNATHDWASFTFQSSRRMGSPAGFSLHILLLFMVILLTPAGLQLAARSLTGRGDRRRTFLALCTALPLSVFVAYGSIRRPMRITWTEPIWLAAIPAMAHQLWFYWMKRGVASKIWKLTIVIVLMLFGGLFHYLTLGLPGAPPPNTRRVPAAWDATASRLDEVVEQVLEETGERPVVVDVRSYYFCSNLNFYGARDGTVRTASHFIGGGGVMYEIWDDPADYAGKPVVLISWARDKLERPAHRDYFDSLGPIHEEPIEFAGRQSARFHWRVGYGFNPAPASDRTTPRDH